MNSPPGKRLLAINFGGLGDEILFLPTLQTIKSCDRSWHITLLTEPRGSAIRQLTPLLDDNLQFDIKKRPLGPADCLQLLALLRGGRFDAVLSSGGSPLVAMLLFLSGIRRRIGFGTNRLAKILLTDSVALNKNQHAACMYHDLAVPIAGKKLCPKPTIEADLDSVQKMRAILDALESHGDGGASGGKKTVLIHPGVSKLSLSKGVVKTWSPSNWSTLIARLVEQGLKVMVAGGPDDEETVAAIFASLQSQGGDKLNQSVVNLMGATEGITDLVTLICFCDLLVCVDSAPMHIAVALNKRLVALFGPTDPAKLLWPDKRFAALRDERAAARFANVDPFKQRPSSARHRAPAGEPAGSAREQPQQRLDVEIPPDIVFRTAMDQLNLDSIPDSSPECHR